MSTQGRDFDLFVFHRDTVVDRACVVAGVAGVVVDLEHRGKQSRQQGFDTQINAHSPHDVASLSAHGISVICRVNGLHDGSRDEIEQVVDAGANEILIPMVRTLLEVDRVFELVNGRAGIGLMIETPEAMALAGRLDEYGLTRMFVGLNDLHITGKKASLFHVLAEGWVEEIRARVQRTPFGFGGLTLPGRGSPLPVEYFFHELARLECRFTFLRRSFFRDSIGTPADKAIPVILERLHRARQRGMEQVVLHQRIARQNLQRVLQAMP